MENIKKDKVKAILDLILYDEKISWISTHASSYTYLMLRLLSLALVSRGKFTASLETDGKCFSAVSLRNSISVDFGFLSDAIILTVRYSKMVIGRTDVKRRSHHLI